MRIFLSTVFIISTLTVFGQSVSYSRVETIITDLNGDNLADTIYLSSSLNDNSFNKIDLSIRGHKKQSFVAKDSWVNVDSIFLAKNKNLINSNRLFLTKSKDQVVILLFGYLDGGGYREEFSIINIKNNNAQMVFDAEQKDIDVEKPVKVADLDNDGIIDFVFTAYHEIYDQIDSINQIGTYSPYFVYSINNPCALNKILTKKYNEDNYVFAGFEYSEEIKVVYPRDGSKPRIIK